MKLMRCFNLIIIKITSLFSYLAEFDSLRGVEHEVMPATSTLPQREAGGRPISPKCLYTHCRVGTPAVIPNHSPGLIVNEGREAARQTKLRKSGLV